MQRSPVGSFLGINRHGQNEVYYQTCICSYVQKRKDRENKTSFLLV